MADLRQYTSLRQNLALAPQMRQSLKILQANTLDLREIASAELNSNPLLEEYKPEGEAVSIEDPIPYRSSYSDNEGRDKFFNSIPERESFQEHLRNQAAFDINDKNVLKAFNFLADFLDDHGFLSDDAASGALGDGFSQKDIDAAIAFMQSCDPAGVGAKNVWESYLLQLRRKKRDNSIAYAILEYHRDLLEKRKIREIAKLLMVAEADVEKAIEEIAQLDQAPAKTFSDEGSRPIFADLVFEKKDGRWTVALTNEYVPRLRINNTYREMIGRGGLSKEDSSYIKEKMRDGKFIIEAIEQRQNTILRIGQVIIEKQHDFFEKGIERMRPMTMAEVAEVIEVNPATISRAVAGKYARIGYNLMVLKDFFAGGYNTEDGQSAVASTSVKEEIRDLVSRESPSKPLSDGHIADMLKKKQIDIARRTVAKYREELGIPAKSLRKRFS